MPRPAPEQPLYPRSVRMTDKQYALFVSLGASSWLRKTLQRRIDATKAASRGSK